MTTETAADRILRLNSREHQDALAAETIDRMADQSEDEDLRMMGLVILAEVELACQEDSEYLRLLAIAGCDQRETRAAMKEERRCESPD